MREKGGYVKVLVTDRNFKHKTELLLYTYAPVSSALVKIGPLLFPVAA